MILDTSFLVDVLRGEEAAADWERRLDEEVPGFVTPVTVRELWEGVHLADSTEEERKAFEAVLDGLPDTDFDRRSGKRAGETSAVLRESDGAVDVEDVTIGAIAAERDEAVLTRNADDFEGLPGVDVREY